jgi:hypothetical protein
MIEDSKWVSKSSKSKMEGQCNAQKLMLKQKTKLVNIFVQRFIQRIRQEPINCDNKMGKRV